MGQGSGFASGLLRFKDLEDARENLVVEKIQSLFSLEQRVEHLQDELEQQWGRKAAIRTFETFGVFFLIFVLHWFLSSVILPLGMFIQIMRGKFCYSSCKFLIQIP